MQGDMVPHAAVLRMGFQAFFRRTGETACHFPSRSLNPNALEILRIKHGDNQDINGNHNNPADQRDESLFLKNRQVLVDTHIGSLFSLLRIHIPDIVLLSSFLQGWRKHGIGLPSHGHIQARIDNAQDHNGFKHNLPPKHRLPEETLSLNRTGENQRLSKQLTGPPLVGIQNIVIFSNGQLFTLSVQARESSGSLPL